MCCAFAFAALIPSSTPSACSCFIPCCSSPSLAAVSPLPALACCLASFTNLE
jgi:hypothetical protein